MTAPAGAVASTLARLRNVADAGGLSFNAILQLYAIERFLARVSRLPDAETVLLKGAMMLRVWGVPSARPTMDVDLRKCGAADPDSLIDLIRRCVAVTDAADAVEFDADSIEAEPITEEAAYIGTRIRLVARLGKVRQAVQIDFGVGDAVFPGPVRIDFPVLLGGEPVRLNAYPVEASIAEKFHAMVEHELRNSRMKDFHDIWTLSKKTVRFGMRRWRRRSGPRFRSAARRCLLRFRQGSHPHTSMIQFICSNGARSAGESSGRNWWKFYRRSLRKLPHS
jgi:hypothetical protein